MGGTALQQFGHDQVALSFINKERIIPDISFYVSSLATGPKVDIYYLKPDDDDTFTSAWSVYGPDFPPEFVSRTIIAKEIADEIDHRLRYKDQDWYVYASDAIGGDLREHILKFYNEVDKEVGDLPDFIGFDEHGREKVWIEVKFEKFGSKEIERVKAQSEMARKRGVNFVLIIPEKPNNGGLEVYGEIPEYVDVYVFRVNGNPVIPLTNLTDFLKVEY